MLPRRRPKRCKLLMYVSYELVRTTAGVTMSRTSGRYCTYIVLRTYEKWIFQRLKMQTTPVPPTTIKSKGCTRMFTHDAARVATLKTAVCMYVSIVFVSVPEYRGQEKKGCGESSPKIKNRISFSDKQRISGRLTVSDC